MKVTVDQGISAKRLTELPIGTLVAVGSPAGKLALTTGPSGHERSSQLLVLDDGKGVLYADANNALRETLYVLPTHVTVSLQNKA